MLATSNIYSLNSGFVRKLLRVIELSGLWNKTWISISIIGVNIKDVVNELVSLFPDAVKIRLSSSKTDAIVFVKLTHLNEVLNLLES